MEAERPVEVMKSVETEQPVVHYEKQSVNTPVTVGKDVRTQVRPRRVCVSTDHACIDARAIAGVIGLHHVACSWTDGSIRTLPENMFELQGVKETKKAVTEQETHTQERAVDYKTADPKMRATAVGGNVDVGGAGMAAVSDEELAQARGGCAPVLPLCFGLITGVRAGLRRLRSFRGRCSAAAVHATPCHCVIVCPMCAPPCHSRAPLSLTSARCLVGECRARQAPSMAQTCVTVMRTRVATGALRALTHASPPLTPCSTARGAKAAAWLMVEWPMARSMMSGRAMMSVRATTPLQHMPTVRRLVQSMARSMAQRRRAS